MPEGCESMRNACRGALPFFEVIMLYIMRYPGNDYPFSFFFLKLGLTIVVHCCRLPCPRLRLFSFSLIFGFWLSFTTSKMIEIKLSRFVLCRHNQGRWACFDMFTINTWDTNLVPKTGKEWVPKTAHTREFCQHRFLLFLFQEI